MNQKRMRYSLALTAAVSLALVGCTGGGGFGGFGGGNGQSSDLPAPAGSGWYVAGALASQKGNQQAAEDYLNRALKENPELITAHSLLGDIYRERGAYAPATQQYEQVAQLDPYGWKNLFNLGLCYQFMGQMEDSVRNYVKSLRIEPKQPEANTNLGMAYLSLGQVDRAVNFAKRGAEMEPTSAAAWANYGLALDGSGHYTEAEEAYRKSLELDSTSMPTLMNYAGNLIQQKKPAEAAEILRKVIATTDSSQARTRLGNALEASGDISGARAEYSKALVMNGRYTPAMNALADLNIAEYEKGLRLDDSLRLGAVEWWKKSLAIQPRQATVSSKLERWEKVDLFGN